MFVTLFCSFSRIVTVFVQVVRAKERLEEELNIQTQEQKQQSQQDAETK